MVKNIAVIRGDGIGPEIVNQAIRVLDKLGELYGHTFNYVDVDFERSIVFNGSQFNDYTLTLYFA
jgi:isocitrate/isopropylmalate dehydrogenase